MPGWYDADKRQTRRRKGQTVSMEFEKLKEAIADILNVDPNEVTEETTFTEDLGADSLDVYQIVMKIEEAFEIEIPAETIKEISTVGEAVLVIRNCI